MSIQFTQYKLPYGKKKIVTYDNPDEETQKLADQLIEEGCKFEIEILRNGQVFMDVIDADDEQVTNQLANNGPEVEEAANKLIRDAIEKRKEKNND